MSRPATLPRYVLPLLLVAGICGVAVTFFAWDTIFTSKAYDEYDLRHYYEYSAWVAGEGTLYREVLSDYLLAPNLLFAVFHKAALIFEPQETPLKSLTWMWVATAWLLYLVTAAVILKQGQPGSIWIWLSPAAVYFSIYRYEIYLVLLTFWFLAELKQERWLRSSLIWGVVIAFKGYGLFLVPAYAVYLLHRAGWRTALTATAATVAPFAISLLVVYGFAGYEGLRMPFYLQGERPNTIESIYSAFTYLTLSDTSQIPQVNTLIPKLFQVALALLAAALRPKTFEQFLQAAMVALVGFIAFGIANSPQFFLWIVPFACLTTSRSTFVLTLLLSWITILDYPVGMYLMHSRVLSGMELTFAGYSCTVANLVERVVFIPAVVVLTALRLALVVQGVRQARGSAIEEPAVAPQVC